MVVCAPAARQDVRSDEKVWDCLLKHPRQLHALRRPTLRCILGHRGVGPLPLTLSRASCPGTKTSIKLQLAVSLTLSPPLRQMHSDHHQVLPDRTSGPFGREAQTLLQER